MQEEEGSRSHSLNQVKMVSFDFRSTPGYLQRAYIPLDQYPVESSEGRFEHVSTIDHLFDYITYDYRHDTVAQWYVCHQSHFFRDPRLSSPVKRKGIIRYIK